MKFIQSSDNIILKTNQTTLIDKETYSPTKLISLVLLFVLVLFLYPLKSAYAIEPEQIPQVQRIVEAFKQNNRVAISKLVSYPLNRPSPLPSINNESEFLRRYDEVFDRTLLNTITQSNIHTDWDSIGWQGVILENGIVSLDPDGNITEINYHSLREQVVINKLNPQKVAKGRRSLHRSINNYDQSVVELTTPRFHIRIDKASRANGNLRYTSWPINKKVSESPDIVLYNGREFNSNGRNQSYVFENGSYSYHLTLDSNGVNTPSAGKLEVFKNNKPLVREAVTRVIR